MYIKITTEKTLQFNQTKFKIKMKSDFDDLTCDTTKLSKEIGSSISPRYYLSLPLKIEELHFWACSLFLNSVIY